MKDVTALLEKYRECAKRVWNECLRERATIGNEGLCRFEQIQRLLFEAIVLDVLGVRSYLKPDPDQPYSFLRVVPNRKSVSILIERPSVENRYWDDPVNRVTRDEVDLRFIDYFDWDQLGHREFVYYRVHIAAHVGSPHLAGRQALLLAVDARVFQTPETTSGPAAVA